MKTIIFLVLIGLAAAGTFQHKLLWRESEMAKMIKRGEWATYLKTKEMLRVVVHKRNVLCSFPHKVLDYEDLEYVANITIGTPDQTFAVMLDTGSGNLWVPSYLYYSLRKRRFNPTKSSTFRDKHHTWSIQYGDGEVQGTLGEDTVRFGSVGVPQLVIPKTTFGLSTKVFDGFKHMPTDGILGLTIQSLASGLGEPPLINAINQKLIDQNLFTVWLARRGVLSAEDGGLFTYGAIDTTNCKGVIAYEPLTSLTHYQFTVSSFKLGSYEEKRNYQVISDTGSSFIVGPAPVISAMAEELGARYDQARGIYFVDCNKNIGTFDITIGDNIYSIQPHNYIIPNKQDTCYFTVSHMDSGGMKNTVRAESIVPPLI